MPAGSSSPIVDQWGRPMRADASEISSVHRAASRSSQEMSTWLPPLTSADGGWIRERNQVAARIHDAVVNNGWASGVVTRHVDQAIGARFRLSSRPDYRALGMDFETARQWALETESKFRNWATDPRRYCDAGRRFTLSQLFGLGFRHTFIDGEALAIGHWIERLDCPYATAVQIVDPDRLSNRDERPDDEFLRGGVEVDKYGAPIAYHIRKSHPGDWYMSGSGKRFQWEVVPRYVPGTTRLQAIHHFEPDRAGQTRGRSRLTPVLERFRMLDSYERTEMQAALLNAIFAGFITTPFNPEETEAALSTAGDYDAKRSAYHDAQGDLRVAGVRLPYLYPGEEPKFMQSARPNTAFGDFEKTVLRYIAAATGQSYEQLAQDWSSTNYSSARAALLESWKFLTARRDAFADGFCTPVYALWLEEALDSGEVEQPEGTPDFWDAPAAWTRCHWRGPARGWVDPTKEAQAAQLRIDGGLSTLQDESDEQGRDWEETLEQRAFEVRKRQELGLPENPTDPTDRAARGADEDPDDRDARERREAGGSTR